MREGAPEDLVLDDAFSAVFSGEGVSFDKSSGSFTVTARGRGSVALHGDGVSAMWTYRALERAGYQVLPEGACNVCVLVKTEKGRPVWSINGGGDRLWRSVEDLLSALDERSAIREKEATHG